MTIPATTARKRRQVQAPSSAILLIGALALGALVYNFGTRPLLEKGNETSAEAEKLEAEVARQRALTGQLPGLEAQNAQLKAQLSTVQRAFPKEEQFANLITEIDATARSYGLTPIEYKRTIMKSDISGVDKLMIQGAFSGRYNQIRRALQKIEQQQRFTSVENIELQTQDSGVKATASFVTYMLRAPEQPSEETASEAAGGAK